MAFFAEKRIMEDEYMNDHLPTYPLFSYNVFAGPLTALRSKLKRSNTPVLISTINPHSFYVADHDELFRKALEQSDVLLPDGVGIVWANWILNGKRIPRITGTDIFRFILQTIHKDEDPEVKRVFFLGASPETLQKIQNKISQEYPSLVVDTYSPPYKPAFDENEVALMTEAINQFRPYVLFVGMTAPKQEKWSFAYRNRIEASVICPIGAGFYFSGGRIKRPGKVWQYLGLEWLGRFVQEPKRLWRRNVISMPYFVKKVLGAGIRKKIRSSR
jgi:N-acetylglucosaminyldiphosphoundecaprenol N-acetyl-beta-D-mannosaminyltransferase